MHLSLSVCFFFFFKSSQLNETGMEEIIEHEEHTPRIIEPEKHTPSFQTSPPKCISLCLHKGSSTFSFGGRPFISFCFVSQRSSPFHTNTGLSINPSGFFFFFNIFLKLSLPKTYKYFPPNYCYPT